jgi:hypothetical protein
MRLVRISWSVVLLSLFALGCGGPAMIKAKGRIVQGGAPYALEEGESFRVFFVPQGMPHDRYDSFAAAFDKASGRFEVMGKDGRGLPPGKYRVDLELMKNRDDLFKGRLMGKKSPFTCEVTSSSDEVVVDLGQVEGLKKTPTTTVARGNKPTAGRKQ